MELMPPLEKRTWELMRCLERRQSQSADGAVDLGTAIAHWSYDFMVRASSFPDTSLFIEGGGRATWSLVVVTNLSVVLRVSRSCARSRCALSQEMMKNGDPHGLIITGKKALVMLDRYVPCSLIPALD